MTLIYFRDEDTDEPAIVMDRLNDFLINNW